jgi:Flp pilus assembly protein TadB
MRWYWMLLMIALTVMVVTSRETQMAIRHLVPGSSMAALPLLLLALAVMAALSSLVLNSRSFGLLALAAGLCSLSLQPGLWRPLERLTAGLPAAADISVGRLLAGMAGTAPQARPGDMPWLLPLALCALLMVGVLTLGTRAE